MARGVRVYELTSGGTDQEVGYLYLRSGRVVSSSPRSPLLREILNTPMQVMPDGRQVTARSDPEAFLENLCYRYKSPYLRASRVEEIDVPPLLPRPLRLVILALVAFTGFAVWLAQSQAGHPVPGWGVVLFNVLLLGLVLWVFAGSPGPPARPR